MNSHLFIHRLLSLAAFSLCALSALTAAEAPKPSPAPVIPTPGWSEEIVRRFSAPEARQGVVADDDFIYVISNHNIGKYRKDTAERVAVWDGPDNGPITHLNAGIVRDGLLYCAHSNYPQHPMLSSVEIWDTRTMKHVGSHSFGRMDGSLTWIVWHDGKWIACFGHYGKEKAEVGRDPSWTQIVSFDEQWRRLEGWAFPSGLIARFAVRGYTSSGGAFGPGGYLYATGHDAQELYVLKMPEAGSVLEWIATVPISAEGQAFGWDTKDLDIFYTLLKRTHEVIVAKLHRPASDVSTSR